MAAEECSREETGSGDHHGMASGWFEHEKNASEEAKGKWDIVCEIINIIYYWIRFMIEDNIKLSLI